MQLSSIWPIDRILSGATTPGQSGPGSDGNEGVLRIPQSSSFTGTSPSDCLVSYPGHSLVGSYSSAEVQLVYSTAPADWAIHRVECKNSFISDNLVAQFISDNLMRSLKVKTVLFYIIQFSTNTQFKSNPPQKTQ